MTPPINCRTIMLDFAASSGLSDASREPRRYLWTDAFAVCNYLELFRQSGEHMFLDLALQLVDQVHQTLGQHRRDGGRSGWLSGLDEPQARLHPTRGGLRIGKPLDERQPGEPPDAAREWDQDGQYFHYLTKWMHALYCVSRETGNDIYLQWALELAKTAHRAFTYTTSAVGPRRMYWKMSIDLSRPLVDSMGQHDPLDGLITYLQLDGVANQKTDLPEGLDLGREIADMRAMCAGLHCATGDSLGIGGLLTDAFKLVQMIDTRHLQESARLAALLDDIEYSLRAFVTQNPLSLPAEYRLAFRELGLTIGLHAIRRMRNRIAQNPGNFNGAEQLIALLNGLTSFRHVHTFIEDFWQQPEHRATENWRLHADINNVMLATTLAPDGYLQL
ncbi:MAG TPA: hypothetical protein VIS57_10155 [Xanthomonadales bacterium]